MRPENRELAVLRALAKSEIIGPGRKAAGQAEAKSASRQVGGVKFSGVVCRCARHLSRATERQS
jgi:hypothetical protein